jgi:hypothetical protein
METEGSIPNSQELSTCSYPEPNQSSPHHPIPPFQDKKIPLLNAINAMEFWPICIFHGFLTFLEWCYSIYDIDIHSRETARQ